jgi:formylmethanofuran dehydrogenase subunit E-like metal-binding protein
MMRTTPGIPLPTVLLKLWKPQATPAFLQIRERKANFSDEEVSSLLEEFGENASVLRSRLTNSVTNKRKKQIWEAVCAKVNSRGTERRTIAELKKEMGGDEKR